MKVKTSSISLLVMCLVPLLWIGCSEPTSPAAKKEPEKPAEPVTGQSALFKMYQKARSSWASDAQVLKMNSIHVASVPSAPGKEGAWQAIFTSTSLGKAQTYNFSVVEQEDLHQGVFPAGGSSSWAGSQGVNTAFDIRAVSIDSDAAYKTAAEKAGSYLTDHPGQPVSLSLGAASRFPAPVWYIIFGSEKSGFAAIINATTGNIISK